MPDVAVSLSSIRKSYASRVALDSVTLQVRRGELFTLLGPNGAGKTTLVEIAEGLQRPDSGEAFVLGKPAGDRSTRHNIGVMLQEPGLYQGLRVKETIELFSSYYRARRSPDELLEALGLDRLATSKTKDLSGGERQRLSLAVALVGSPRLLFLDEPTAGMDPIARADTWQLLQDLTREGATIVLTTHGLEEAEYLSDRLAILASGKIVVTGKIDELLSGDAITFRASGDLDLDRLRTDTGKIVGYSGRSYRVEGASDPRTMADITAAAAAQGVSITEMTTGRSLEELYRSATETSP